jgi:hypothetical protein
MPGYDDDAPLPPPMPGRSAFTADEEKAMRVDRARTIKENAAKPMSEGADDTWGPVDIPLPERRPAMPPDDATDSQ